MKSEIHLKINVLLFTQCCTQFILEIIYFNKRLIRTREIVQVRVQISGMYKDWI